MERLTLIRNLSGNLLGLSNLLAPLWRPSVLVVTAAALVLGILGPYGTHNDMEPLSAILYWAVVIFGGWGLFALTEMFVQVYAPASLSPVSRGLLLSVTASVPITLLVWAVGILWQTQMPVSWLWLLYFYVLVITVTMAGIGAAVSRALSGSPRRVAAFDGPPETPPFLKRLNGRVAEGDLLAVASEDHYLRVHTTRGSDLILMRLGDAVEELARADGLRVHRSFWVARSAVQGIERENGKPVLVLQGGLRVPVSRTYLPDVRAAGWFDEVPARRPAGTAQQTAQA